MKSFECSICSTQFKDPVECLKCSNNFCKLHISNFNNRCPLCHNTPFIYRENVWLKRTLLNLNDFYKCSICQFEGDYDSFWSHLIESHKNEIINQFKCKKNNCEEKSINFQPPKINSIQKSIGTNVPIPTHRYNPPPNIMQNKFKTENKNLNNANKFNIIQNSTERKPYYCKKLNNQIKCDCCPDHICKEGNCMCIDCMKINRKNLNLQNKELINKAGKVAKFFKGSFYCDDDYVLIIKNIVGKKFKKNCKCQYPSEPCNNCKPLSKFQKLYYGKDN